jgi:hypothetical protein
MAVTPSTIAPAIVERARADLDAHVAAGVSESHLLDPGSSGMLRAAARRHLERVPARAKLAAWFAAHLPPTTVPESPVA